MGGGGAGQRLCFWVAPRGAHSHQRELKPMRISFSSDFYVLEELTRISAN